MPERKWTAQHEHEIISQPGRRFNREFFYACEFRNLRGSMLHQCSGVNCKLDPASPEDLFGATVTLDCYTFEGLELNELAFDSLLYLLSITTGNDRKRQQVLSLIEGTRRAEFESLFQKIGRVRG